MRIKTHKYIADTAITLVENITGISFNHKMIKIGACAPDFAINRRLKLHNPKLAGVEYKKMLIKFNSGNRSRAFLSYMLGAYSHYVSDAFCLAHNSYVSDLKSHMQYEVMLQDMLYDTALPVDMLDRILDKKEMLRALEVPDYIEIENAKYMDIVNKGITWEDNARIDITLAIINSAVLMLQFVREVEAQQVLAPAI